MSTTQSISTFAHGVGSDRDAILVEEADHLSINRGIDLRVTADCLCRNLSCLES